MSSNRTICSAAERRRAILRWGSLALVIFAAGCGRRETPPPRSYPAARPAPSSSSIGASAYLPRAASASLLIIRASELAIYREGDTGLGQFARQFKTDHEGIAAQLSFAGRRLNLLPSAILLPADQAILDSLANSNNPSQDYIRQMKLFLPQILALHRRFERGGGSPTLRPVAAMAAPILASEVEAILRF